MSELEAIQRKADELKLQFLLIGGLAVIEHGFARLTADLDLMVRARQKEQWRQCLEGLGYLFANDGQNFHQYERKNSSAWPLDLMLVNDATFDGLSTTSVPARVFGTSLYMVSLNHLIALKLHVLKQGKLQRVLKDLNDVVELAKANRLDLKSFEMRDLFLRYGNAEIYDQVQRLTQAG